jgi:hypothetical protein
VILVTSSSEAAALKPKRRTLGEQLNRNPRTMHASWMAGLAVLVTGVTAGGFSLPGLLFLGVLFLPIVIAYRRDRISFPIVFATLFLPTWPWAMYKACSHKARTAAA